MRFGESPALGLRGKLGERWPSADCACEGERSCGLAVRSLGPTEPALGARGGRSRGVSGFPASCFRSAAAIAGMPGAGDWPARCVGLLPTLVGRLRSLGAPRCTAAPKVAPRSFATTSWPPVTGLLPLAPRAALRAGGWPAAAPAQTAPIAAPGARGGRSPSTTLRSPLLPGLPIALPPTQRPGPGGDAGDAVRFCGEGSAGTTPPFLAGRGPGPSP